MSVYITDPLSQYKIKDNVSLTNAIMSHSPMRSSGVKLRCKLRLTVKYKYIQVISAQNIANIKKKIIIAQ